MVSTEAIATHRRHDDLVFDEFNNRFCEVTNSLGAFEPSALPAMRKITDAITAARTEIMATLLNDGNTSLRRRISLIGGNSSANTFVSFLLFLRAGRF